MAQNSREISNELFRAVENAERSGKVISVGEFRHLFLKGLAALIRETDSTAYRLKQMQEGGR